MIDLKTIKKRIEHAIKPMEKAGVDEYFWGIRSEAGDSLPPYCKYTRFSSTHFLRFRYFQLITGILPVSDYSGIHVDAPGYIPSASVP